MARIMVRDAAEADLPALTAIKGAGSEAVHPDRPGDTRHNATSKLQITNVRANMQPRGCR